MYEIYVRINDPNETNTALAMKNEVLWAPGLEDTGYILYSAFLELEINHSGKLTFQMSPKHPLYDRLLKRKSIVTVTRNGTEIWRGRVLDSKNDFYKRKTVVCEGALSYLLDVTVRPYTFNGTIKRYFDEVLAMHNRDCDPGKTVVLGDITAVDPETEISITEQSSQEYPSVLDDINDKMVANYGGYLRVRPITDSLIQGFYLDYLSTSGVTIDQKIEFGKNLLDLEDYITSENVCTRCIPLGATLREIEDFKEYQDPNYVSDLNDEDGDKRLDITSVTTGNVDYIEHDEGITLFGKITRCIVFDNIVTADSLLTNAQEWLEANVAMTVSMEIKAIDLSLITDDIDAIECGTSVEVISAPHEIDVFMLCRSLKVNILSPAETDYIFGVGFTSMTDQQAKTLKQSAKAIGTAASASTSVKNIATTVVGKYLTAGEFNSFKDEINNTLDNIDTLPEPTSLDDGKVLKIVNGKWSKAEDNNDGETASEALEKANKVDDALTKFMENVYTLLDGDDVTLDQISEIVAYIKSNKELIDAVTTSKVSVDDIIDGLDTSDAKKVLSAKQGVELKNLIASKIEKLSNTDSLVKFYYEKQNKGGTALLQGKTGYVSTENYTSVAIRGKYNDTSHPGTFEVSPPELDTSKKTYSAKHPMTVGVAEGRYVKTLSNTDSLTKFYYEKQNNGGTDLLRGKIEYEDIESYQAVAIRGKYNDTSHPGTFEVSPPELDTSKKTYSAKHPMTVGVAEGRYAKQSDLTNGDIVVKSAEKATQDGNGDNIATTYTKNSTYEAKIEELEEKIDNIEIEATNEDQLKDLSRKTAHLNALLALHEYRKSDYYGIDAGVTVEFTGTVMSSETKNSAGLYEAVKTWTFGKCYGCTMGSTPASNISVSVEGGGADQSNYVAHQIENNDVKNGKVAIIIYSRNPRVTFKVTWVASISIDN